MMFMLVVAPMRAVGVSRALMEVARRVSAINGFFARARTLLTVRDDEWRRRSRFLVFSRAFAADRDEIAAAGEIAPPKGRLHRLK